MIILQESNSAQSFSFIPRSDSYNILQLTNEQTGVTVNVAITTNVIGEYFNTITATFALKQNNFYTLTLLNNATVVFKDKVFCTNQSIPTFSVNTGQYITNQTAQDFGVYTITNPPNNTGTYFSLDVSSTSAQGTPQPSGSYFDVIIGVNTFIYKRASPLTLGGLGLSFVGGGGTNFINATSLLINTTSFLNYDGTIATSTNVLSALQGLSQGGTIRINDSIAYSNNDFILYE